MDDIRTFALTVHLVHGGPIKFEVTNLSDAKLMGVVDDLEKAKTNNLFVFDLDGKLMMIPYNSINYIECDPVPPDLTYTMLRGTKRLSD